MGQDTTNKKADIPEIERDEHSTLAQAKRAVIWGWDSVGGSYVKLAVDSNGQVKLA